MLDIFHEIAIVPAFEYFFFFKDVWKISIVNIANE